MYGKYHKYHIWSRLLVILAISLTSLITSCQRGGSSNSQKGKAKEPVQKALSWVLKHPASFNDGALIEISEEILAFHILYRYTQDGSEKDNYLKEIKKRLDLIASNHNLKVQPTEYTMVLAITEIAEKLGLQTPELKKIIEGQIISDPLLYPSHITSCIWNTVYLKRLGYNPPKTLEELMTKSTLSQEVSQGLVLQYTSAQFNPMYVDPVATTVYDLTHEIFALTDFGELPPPTVIAENLAFFNELFDQGIEWAITATHEDVLAEMIMCVKLLNLRDISSLEQGIDYIISRQEKDGSFGVTNPGRSNVYRHGILVSIMALTLAGG
ncbi:MAG: hypothetical protein AB1847_07865 [bacterium]